MIEVKFLQLRHDLAQILVRRRRQVEAADERIDFFDAADLLSPPQRVYDARVSA